MRSDDLWADAIREMEGRRQKGLETYNRPVTADQTIDWLKHATEEFWDGGIYCLAAQNVMERLKQRVLCLEETLRTAISLVTDRDAVGKLQQVLEDRV